MDADLRAQVGLDKGRYCVDAALGLRQLKVEDVAQRMHPFVRPGRPLPPDFFRPVAFLVHFGDEVGFADGLEEGLLEGGVCWVAVELGSVECCAEVPNEQRDLNLTVAWAVAFCQSGGVVEWGLVVAH